MQFSSVTCPPLLSDTDDPNVSNRIRASFAAICCLLLLLTIVIAAQGQGSPQGTIKHVIVVIQENRTPDNLFYAIPDTMPARYNVHPPNGAGLCKKGTQQVSVPLAQYGLDNHCFDPRHHHTDWLTTYNAPPNGGPGTMDGACNAVITYYDTCNQGNVYQCPTVGGACPQYSYVPNTSGVLDPYFNIAMLYGFANWMFQTNQGPSLPAHQFLFSGTSAPAPYDQNNDYYRWFVAENAIWTGHPHQGGSNVGCSGPVGEYVKTVDPSGNEGACPSFGTNNYCAYPCFNHPNMGTDVLDPNISWAYYGTEEKGLWTAPNTFQTICGPPNNQSCNLQEWQTHVEPFFPVRSGDNKEYAPILRDIRTVVWQR